MRKSDRRDYKILLCLGVAGIIFLLFLASCSMVPDRLTTLSSVVRVDSDGGFGSGVVVKSGRKSIILTNAHVVSDDMVVRGKKATLIRKDEEKDLALIEVELQLPAAHIHKTASLKVFDEIILVGAGLGSKPYPSLGIVANIITEYGVQYSGHVVVGMSGGGVFRRHNDHYELVGIVQASALQASFTGMFPFPIHTPVNNMGYFIPLVTVMEFLND